VLTTSVVILAALGVVAVVRLPRRIAPYHYFEVHELIHGVSQTLTWQGIFVRFATPLAVALLATLPLGKEPVLAGGAIGFLSGLLLIWPAFLDPRLLPGPLWERQGQVRLIYLMFVGSFVLAGVVGGFLASYLYPAAERLFEGESFSDAIREIDSRIDDLLVGVIGTLLLAAIAKLYDLFQKTLSNE